jgi:hypothetical protein
MPAVFALTGQLEFRPQVVAGLLDWALLAGKRLEGKAAVVMRSP